MKLVSLLRYFALAGTMLILLMQHLFGQVTVSGLFTSGMVLQQKSEANIWGWAGPGDTITVWGSWNNTPVQTITGADKKWITKLTTPEARTDGTAYTLTIKGKNTIVLSNVLIGEVWLLSGQSNMEMPLNGWDGAPVEGGAQAIASANHPTIRLIIIGKKSVAVPQTNIEKNWVDGTWTACTPASAKPFSALGYFFGKEIQTQLGIPVGLVQSAWGGSSCETWANEESLNRVTDFKNAGPWSPTKTDDNQTPTLLYNGMIAPLVPFTFAGVLWYQGETNVGRPGQLSDLFPAMIEGWRKEFRRDDLPFYFVQLCPYGGYGGALPQTWEAQAYAQHLKNTGMVGTLDVGDVTNIHPARKEQVGHRLALWALAKNYGHTELVYSGPQYRSMAVEGNKIRLSFDYTGAGLKAENNAPTQFEIAGADLVFRTAQTSIDDDQLLVWNNEVATPKHVRYAWSDTATASLKNNEGLPATPFRTDIPAYLEPVKANLLIGAKTIKKGQVCLIDWTTFGASEVSLNGEILASYGQKDLRPDTTTTYTFLAKGEDMSITRSFTVYVNPDQQTAYPGNIPWPIPGAINPTFYDQGGEGESYHDLSFANAGDGIRPEQGVDTEFRLPEGSVGGIETGEWLEYTVDVAEDGFYDFEILFATTGRYGKFHLEFDGSDKTGLIPVFSTGSYSKFTPKKISAVALKKGIQVMRIYFDYAEYNLGTISVTQNLTATNDPTAANQNCIFPSPARDKIFISGNDSWNRFVIVDLNGQILLEGKPTKNEQVDISKLKPGYYLIQLKRYNVKKIEKFLKL